MDNKRENPGGNVLIPLLISIGIATLLYLATGWWGFLIIFPWIGFAISFGLFLKKMLPARRKGLGRRITILMVMPMLLFFVPIVNHENFQLEGVVLLILAGILTKGVIHYAIAKIFGPLIWGRGFCGWACWTAAILEWLPIKKGLPIPAHLKRIRYVALIISIALPLSLVFFFNYRVIGNYVYRQERQWMFVGNGIYYIIAIPLAFTLNDPRAFCKIVCPVSLVMKVPTLVSAIKLGPSGKECNGCGACIKRCPMDIDVMSFIKRGQKVMSTECILCDECRLFCPTGAIK